MNPPYGEIMEGGREDEWWRILMVERWMIMKGWMMVMMI
jgi:hypothetical protein